MDITKRSSLATFEGDIGVPRREEIISSSFSASYPIITSSILREDDDDDVLVRSISRTILGGDNGQILPTSTTSSSLISDDSDADPRPPGLAGRIPFFGLLCSMLSVVCFSLASLIVKILTDLHALEILAIR